MEITRTSQFTGEEHTLDIPITAEEYGKGMIKRMAGAHIQDAFPMLDEDQREFLLTGATKEEWDRLMPPEEDED